MTSDALVTRVVPPISARWRGRYLVERNYMSTKTYWPVVASGFFEPIFYLFAPWRTDADRTDDHAC